MKWNGIKEEALEPLIVRDKTVMSAQDAPSGHEMRHIHADVNGFLQTANQIVPLLLSLSLLVISEL